MKRKALSLSEIVEHRLLPLKTTKGVNDWIIAGKIKLPSGTRSKKDINE
jgi:hypothetical protein